MSLAIKSFIVIGILSLFTLFLFVATTISLLALTMDHSLNLPPESSLDLLLPVENSFDPDFLEANGALDEANDDFDSMELPQDSPNDGYWISDEQVEELAGSSNNNVYPKATEWKDVSDNEEMMNLRVTVDKARRFLWKQAKTEISILRDYWGEDHPSFHELAANLYGEQSKLFHLFEEELQLDYETFCRFLATFYTASSLSIAAPRLYELNSRFDTTGLMETKEEFMKIIRRMETIDEGNDGDSLWMKIEYAYNSEMRKIFLSKRGNNTLSIALDDDKVHFNYSKSAKTYGLKKHRHIKDNRFGHTLHTAGFSAIGAILCALFEREGETSTEVYERSVKFLFGSRTGNGAPDLTGLTFCSDRGYWTANLVFDKLLMWGADVVGTVARCFWYPFTFKKGKPSNDDGVDKFNRTEISMKGYKDIFYKTLKYFHIKIRATCYRTGTGTAVSLAMSTVHHGPIIDLNLSFPKDHIDYFDTTQTQETRNAKAFPLVFGSSAYYDKIKSLPIIPLTLVQGDTSWFIMRQFGLTSSTVDRTISARAGEITQDHSLREAYEIVLSAVDRMHLLPRAAAVDDEEEGAGDDNATTASADNNSIDSLQDESHQDDEARIDSTARNWTRRVKGGDGGFILRMENNPLEESVMRKIAELNNLSNPSSPMPTLREQLRKWAEEFPARDWIRRVNEGDHTSFVEMLNEKPPRESIIRKIVEVHDHSNHTSSLPTLKKQLEKWAEAGHRLKRFYHWYKKADLVDRIKEIGSGNHGTKNKDVLLNLLVEIETQQSIRAAAVAAGEDPYSSTDTIDPVLLQVFKASFMKPLKDDAKKYCRKGHELERPFLEQFFEHSRQGKTIGYKALAIHETPLVKSSLESLPAGILDSSDAELVYSDRDDDSDDEGVVESLAMPIEIKSRLSLTTFYDERNRFEANLGHEAFENDGEPRYIELDAEGEELSRWIPKKKERFQLLHHVAIRDVRKGLILVGNSKNVMFGIFVTFSDALIEAYQEVLKNLFDRALKPFYAPATELQLPKVKIEKIIKSRDMKRLGLSLHSFSTAYFVWRRMRLEGDVHLPIPPCNRILPYNHSFWNNLKGASDTATKLFWNCQSKLASYGRSQTVCISRFLQLYSVCIHRQNHVATAKTNLNKYGSLVHFRNTRNRHLPFHKTVNGIAVWLIKQADECNANRINENTNPSNASSRNAPLCTPERVARSNPSRAFQEDRIYATVCGATPGRGKPKFPTNKTPAWEEDQRRLHNCNGNIFKAEGRNPCYLCDTKTNFHCTGCKRWYCLVSRHKKIHDLIVEDRKVVRFLNGICPPSTFDIKALAADGTTSSFIEVENSCYHICHKDAISKGGAATLLRSPLAPIEE